ncbi:Piso0_005274 [Millerozyma farinosa CBS 7064]|uniref:Piso0_005274 protein n=1 Tax=Pichia sorbitophila (strain ATCC MYA-4447 / BCRC 22081 / CBS 7064 / NBRC 10061 / NRRL Y-12695) TaxID=559304 RepID=G8Y4N8_PICSO|nr:Piso0_005274 [Millerozyma farinosa CBS 7064]
MQEEQVSIDHLEDQLIDNPDVLTKTEIDNNALDETFQKKLNARAEQIANQRGVAGQSRRSSGERRSSVYGIADFPFFTNKYNLDYDYKDLEDLATELSEWFAHHDYKMINLDTLGTNRSASGFSVESIKEELSEGALDHLDDLLYYTFGAYRTCFTQGDQVRNIQRNCCILIKNDILNPLALCLKSFYEEYLIATNEPSFLDLDEETECAYFKLLTILYFVLTVLLESKDEIEFESAQNSLTSTDILSIMVDLIQKWTWRPSQCIRARYLIMITWKLILIEMGDHEDMAEAQTFLLKKYNINNINDDGRRRRLKCSPLDYFTFREDLLDKFPLCEDNNFSLKESITKFDSNFRNSDNDADPALDKEYEYFMALNQHSNSMTNLIEHPRPNKEHTVLSQLPAQTVHISTPVPSPPSTPSEFMAGGEKVRRSYQINQAMPFIYPTTEDAKVPAAIEEASDIIKNSVYESYSTKQLWNERRLFMVQERGYVSTYSDEVIEKEMEINEETYSKFPEHRKSIRSLLRVESFYKQNLSRLSSLVSALIAVMKSNRYDYNLNYAEWELNPETSYLHHNLSSESAENKGKVEYLLMQQLEVIRTKEVTLKACSSIVLLLLKWFKLSHILKYYQLSSILYDQKYFDVLFEHLNRSINNKDLQELKRDSGEDGTNEPFSEYDLIVSQNQLMNPKIELPKFDFFNNCLHQFPSTVRYQFINKTPLSNFSSKVDANNVNQVTINRYNRNYCRILVNLLNIANKVLIKNLIQRIFTINEHKPSEILKIILTNYDNKALSKPALKILKKIVPYQGRKWKSLNMELISKIYLNCQLGLRDTWLSGRDLDNDFNNSVNQEIALRALIQFYNMREYPESMKALGYGISEDDPFNLSM